MAKTRWVISSQRGFSSRQSSLASFRSLAISSLPALAESWAAVPASRSASSSASVTATPKTFSSLRVSSFMACLLPPAPEAPRYPRKRRCTGTTRSGTATHRAFSSGPLPWSGPSLPPGRWTIRRAGPAICHWPGGKRCRWVHGSDLRLSGGQRRQRPLVPAAFWVEAVLLAKRLQLRQVGHRLDPQVPAQLAQAHRARVHRPAVLLLLVITAVHQAQVGGAVCQAEDVASFVGGRAEGQAQAQPEVRLRVAVAVDGPDADPLAQAGLPEDEVPALPRPQVRGGQGQVRQGVSGPLRFQNLVENVARQNLRVAPRRVDAPGPCRD